MSLTEIGRVEKTYPFIQCRNKFSHSSQFPVQLLEVLTAVVKIKSKRDKYQGKDRNTGTTEYSQDSTKSKAAAGCRWLMPIILATQKEEAEIKRIMVQGQPGQIIHETLS
jgi:hypothetical protein